MRNVLEQLQYSGTITHEEYGELPLYEMNEFVNTVEGWNLFVQCYPYSMQEFYEAEKQYNRFADNLLKV